MSKNVKIKIIKKGEAVKPAPESNDKPAEKRHAAREMVSTVKNWVSDFQARKRDETKMALETLLVTKPRPSEII